MAAPKKDQIRIVERLQAKLLERFEHLLDTGEMSATDAATLVRLLSQNGWTLDPTALPQGLKDKMADLDIDFGDPSKDEIWA